MSALQGAGFAAQGMLWLLLILPLFWLSAWRHRAGLGRGRMLLATLLRSVAFGLLVVALANPVVVRPTRGLSVVYALDVSRSISHDFIVTALGWIRDANAAGRPQQARYVAFGSEPRGVDSLDALRRIALADQPASSGDTVNRDATNLERALDGAMFGFAPDLTRRLVLITDGNATEGDVWRALPMLRAQDVRVFTIPAAVAEGRTAWIEGVEASPGVREREQAALTVRLFAHRPTEAAFEVDVDAERVRVPPARLAAGASEVNVPVQFRHAGASRVKVRVLSGNGTEIDRAEQTVWVQARPKVLYVESKAQSARHLRDALRGQGIDVTVAEPAAMESGRLNLAGVDALVLSDVPPRAMTGPAAARVERYVRDGGALIFAAGENAYGSEGYAQSPLEKVLPVKFQGPRKRRDLDLVILIDRSFSMHGRKIEYAKTAALSALDLLEEQHRLAVVAFDSRPHDIVTLAEVGAKRRAEDLIGTISAGGETNIMNALWHADVMLRESKAKTKHIVLISDGETAPASGGSTNVNDKLIEELIKNNGGLPARRKKADPDADAGPRPASFEEMTKRLAASGVTLSTVAIGEDPKVDFLTGLARATGGSSYLAGNDQDIPALMVKDTRKLLGESFIEEPFRPTVKVAGAALEGVAFPRAPQLKGHVIAQAKASGEVLLEAPDKHPLLVQGHHGLGRTVVFLSDVKDRWSADWLAWPGYARLWAQVVRDSVRRDGAELLAFTVEREGADARVALTARSPDGQFRNGLAPKLSVTPPGGGATVVALRQTGPGSYSARVPLVASAAGAYAFNLAETPGIAAADIARAGARSVYYAHSDEDRVAPADRGLLAALADRTGGRFEPSLADIFAPGGEGGKVSHPLWQYFAAGGILSFLLDVLARRWMGMPRRRPARQAAGGFDGGATPA